MPVRIFFHIVIVLLISCLNAEAGQESITLHYPPDGSVLEYNMLEISMSVPAGSADSIKVYVNDEEEPLNVIADQEYECFSVQLKLGVNRINIIAVKGDYQVYKTELKVFRRSDLASEYIKTPDGFKKDFFHMKEWKQCARCHILSPIEYDRKPISPYTFKNMDKQALLAVTSTCYMCHNKITANKYVHGPAAVWSCLSCHDPEAEPKYSVKKPDAEICYECHTEQKKDRSLKKYSHGPVTIGKCTICHSPHASENPFNLVKPTWNLCVNCHAEKASGMHVLGDSMFKEGHPTRNRPDPVRTGKELTCASCHNPHASNYPHLWAFEVETIFDLCQKCHNKQTDDVKPN
ncbi:MAG: hypothetical protein HZA14_05460 [Nitrospirae bacterium]|nr:hypothetical protein [Nitrospirota bacterium]